MEEIFVDENDGLNEDEPRILHYDPAISEWEYLGLLETHGDIYGILRMKEGLIDGLESMIVRVHETSLADILIMAEETGEYFEQIETMSLAPGTEMECLKACDVFVVDHDVAAGYYGGPYGVWLIINEADTRRQRLAYCVVSGSINI